MLETSFGASRRPVQSRSLAWAALITCVVWLPYSQAQQVQQPSAATSRTRNAAERPVRSDTAEAARLVIALTNDLRRQHNLPPTGPAPQLASTARYFADFMARTAKYGHSADGQQPAARAKRFGYEYCIVAENIANLFRSDGIGTEELARRLVEGWKNSPEHRQNMLDSNVTETAVAVAQSASTNHYYAVQLFGRPLSQSIEFRVANQAGGAVEYKLDGQTFQLPVRTTNTHQICKLGNIELLGKTLQPANGQKIVVVNDQNGPRLQLQ